MAMGAELVEKNSFRSYGSVPRDKNPAEFRRGTVMVMLAILLTLTLAQQIKGHPRWRFCSRLNDLFWAISPLFLILKFIMFEPIKKSMFVFDNCDWR